MSRRVLRVGVECVVVVAGATLVAAVLDRTTSAAALSLVFLVPVLVVAVRHGLGAGLATAVLGALSLNWFFIAPVHRLEVRHSDDIAALIAYLAVAAVTGRLASAARAREAEADQRARLASPRQLIWVRCPIAWRGLWASRRRALR
jgi:two-component system sensor histidine kinase KdpD